MLVYTSWVFCLFVFKDWYSVLIPEGLGRVELSETRLLRLTTPLMLFQFQAWAMGTWC